LHWADQSVNLRGRAIVLGRLLSAVAAFVDVRHWRQRGL